MCVHNRYLCIWFDQKTTMKTKNPFDKLAMQDLYWLIAKGDSLSDEAMHYLLSLRMRACLKDVYDVYESRCRDGYEDMESEFFLYLREGAHSDNNVPYEALLGLQHPEALASWMQSTFRNYLNNRVASEAKKMELLADYPEDVGKAIAAMFRLIRNERLKPLPIWLPTCSMSFSPENDSSCCDGYSRYWTKARPYQRRIWLKRWDCHTILIESSCIVSRCRHATICPS